MLVVVDLGPHAPDRAVQAGGELVALFLHFGDGYRPEMVQRIADEILKADEVKSVRFQAAAPCAS